MITKYQEELSKLGLEFVVVNEDCYRFRGVILNKDGEVILHKINLYKELAPSKIPEFAAMTKKIVDTHMRTLGILKIS